MCLAAAPETIRRTSIHSLDFRQYANTANEF
jgi:hypothetical protein